MPKAKVAYLQLDERALAAAYAEISTPCDRLPYSEKMTKLIEVYARKTGCHPSRRTVWLNLVNLRKNSKLPRLGYQGSIEAKGQKTLAEA